MAGERGPRSPAPGGSAGSMQPELVISTSQLWCCRLCLSAERALSCARGSAWAYGVLTQQERCDGEEARVCWECAAELRRMLRFKRRALRARELLERARAQLAHADALPSLPCLSTLTSSTKTYYDASIVHPSEPWDALVDVKEPPHSPLPFDMEISTEIDFASHLQLKGSRRDGSEAGANALDGGAVPKSLSIKVEPDLSDGDVWPEGAPEGAQEEAPEGAQEEAPADEPVVVKRERGRGRPRGKRRKVRMKEEPVKEENLLDPAARRDSLAADACDTVRERRADVLARRAAALRSAKFQRRRVKCLPCGVSFHAPSGLARHHADLHCEAADAVSCETCLCRLPDAAALRAHGAAHELYKCRRCRFTTRSVKNMRRHHAAHERTRHRQAISCDACGKQFMNKQHFYVHYKTHTSKQTYECDHCGRVYKTRTQMFRHLRSHRKDFLCDICGKTFSDQTYLNCHYLAHADPSQRRFECPVCHKRYINKFKLIVHMRFHTGEKPFKCDVCDKEFREKAQLTSHNKKVHSAEGGGIKKKRTFERTKSAFVNERFVESKDKPHESEAEDKHPDDDKKERVRKETTTPKIARTKEKKDIVCNFCGLKFKDKWRLKFHLAVHSDERPYKCSECDLTFKYQSGLWTHKLLHKGEKHQCTICGALFTQKGNLTAHLKIHTGEKPFECNVCGNKFRMRRNLRNHFKTHSNVGVV